MAHHEKGQVSNLSFFVVHHPSELVTRQTSLPSFVNLRSKFLPRAPIAKGYGKRQYSVLLQDAEVCRGTPACGKRQYSLWRTKIVVFIGDFSFRIKGISATKAFVALKFFTIFTVGQKVKECQDRMHKKDQTP